jgi:hypothetical protein
MIANNFFFVAGAHVVVFQVLMCLTLEKKKTVRGTKQKRAKKLKQLC